MLEVKRDDFDESLEDIMMSLNSILNKSGVGIQKTEEKDDKKENK